MFDIVRTQGENPISSDFVAIAFLDGEPDPHSAFVIQYSGSIFEYHFKGLGIIYQPVESDYLHKILFKINKESVPAFIAHCRNVKRKAKPIYGYFYSGEWYDTDVNFLGNKDLGQRMTCVGFCLNILRGFLKIDYLEYSDWKESSHDESGYLENYCSRYGLDIEKVRDSHRRIAPIELFTSGFCSSSPVQKTEIEALLPQIKVEIETKLSSGQAS